MLWLTVLSAQAAPSCPELVEVTTVGALSEERLLLSVCDVKGNLEPATDGSGRIRLVLDLSPASARRFRAALEDGGRLAVPLTASRLKVSSAALSIKEAPLLPAASARRHAQLSWLWDGANGRLSIALVAEKDASVLVRDCPKGGTGEPLLWVGTREVFPGTVITPMVVLSPRPGSILPVAPDCIGGWSLSVGASAAVHPTLGLVAVAVDAPDGSLFTISAKLKYGTGAVVVNGAIRVVDARRHLLAGTWRQVEELVCRTPNWRPPARPIGELAFDSDGQFAVTWQPFEAYRDYWGTFSHDRTEGSLRLEVTGGNRPPKELVTTGRAEVDTDGLLTLHGVTLDNGETAMPACAIRFRRN